MKILMLSHEYPPVGGGGATACRELAARFARHGHEVTVITAGFEGLTGKEVTPDGATILRLPVRRRYADHCSFMEMLDYLLHAVKKAWERERRAPSDACLCFFGIPAGPVAWYLKKAFALPYVVRFGGGDIPGFQDRFRLLYRLLQFPVRLVWKEASALAANSEGLRKTALNFCGKYPVVVIPNGVDTAVFTPGSRGGEPGTVRLLSVCRIVKRKGLQDVIRAMPSLEKAAGRPVRLTIVGDGPYRENLEQLARETGVADRVVMAGICRREEVPAFYRDADIFCFPSYREGMPNTVLEAMACGLPVVMREECQGAWELVQGNGVLSKGDYGEALAAFMRLPAETWEKMGRISRQRAEGFSWEITASRYERLLEEAAQEGTGCLKKQGMRSRFQKRE